jgi:hypothetical protein
MAESVEIFGNHPFPPDRKRPLHIQGDLIRHFIYPAERPTTSVAGRFPAPNAASRLSFSTTSLRRRNSSTSTATSIPC